MMRLVPVSRGFFPLFRSLCRCAPPTVALVLGLHCGLAMARVARSHGQSAQMRPPARPAAAAPVAGHPVPRPGYLGVGLRNLDAAEATRLHLHGAMAAEIVTVDRDAPAWAAGLRRGDIVIDFNGNPVAGLEDLSRRLRACAEGETVTLRVRHNGEERTVAVTLGDEQTIAEQALNRHLDTGSEAAPATPEIETSPLPGGEEDFVSPAPPSPTPPTSSHGITSTLLDALIPASYYTGLEVDPLTTQLALYFGVPGRGGLLVTAVSAHSPADLAGLTAGDVILAAGGNPVLTRSALAHAVRSAKGMPVALLVQRNRRSITLSLQPGRRRP
jgi:serine protease Do